MGHLRNKAREAISRLRARVSSPPEASDEALLAPRHLEYPTLISTRPIEYRDRRLPHQRDERSVISRLRDRFSASEGSDEGLLHTRHIQYHIGRSPYQGYNDLDGTIVDSRCTIFHLPRRARDTIYKFVLSPTARDGPPVEGGDYELCPPGPPIFTYKADTSLLLTCHLFYNEGRNFTLQFDEHSVPLETALKMYWLWEPWQRLVVSIAVVFPRYRMGSVVNDRRGIDSQRHNNLKELIKWGKEHDNGISAVQILHIPQRTCSWDDYPQGLPVDVRSMFPFFVRSLYQPNPSPEWRRMNAFFEYRLAMRPLHLAPESTSFFDNPNEPMYFPVYLEDIRDRAFQVVPLRPPPEDYLRKDHSNSNFTGPYMVTSGFRPGIRVVIPCWVRDPHPLVSVRRRRFDIIQDREKLDMVRLDWTPRIERNIALNLEFLKNLRSDIF